jgi:hypothetical protein
MIDELVNPDLRDSMILLRGKIPNSSFTTMTVDDIFVGRYDLVECLHLASSNLEVHGEDVLAHHNWEFKEAWLRAYGFVLSSLNLCSQASGIQKNLFSLLYRFLVEQPLLNVCNRWRRERGEPDLTLGDIRSGDNGRGEA